MTLRRPDVLLGVLLLSSSGCLRAPIREYRESDGAEATAADEPDDNSSSTGQSESSGSSEASSGSPTPDDACHPSYDPCLPIVDELNCPDVVALGAAPVTVIGPDVYGLDSDNDGIGCEP